MAGQELGLFLDPAGKLVDVRQWRCASARLLNVILEAAMELVMPVDVVVHDHAAGRRIAGDPLDARYRRERLGDLLQQFGIALGGRDFHANPARHLMGDVEFELGHGLVSQPMTAAPGASRRGHGRTRRGFGCGSLFVAFGVDLRDNVMHVLMGLSDHFAGFLPHLVGAPRTVDLTRGLTAPPSLGRYFGTSIVAMPSTRPGSRAASKMITPAPTTATVAAVATSSSWLSANSSKPSAGSFASLSAILPPLAASDLYRSMEFLSSALDQGALTGTRDWSRNPLACPVSRLIRPARRPHTS